MLLPQQPTAAELLLFSGPASAKLPYSHQHANIQQVSSKQHDTNLNSKDSLNAQLQMWLQPTGVTTGCRLTGAATGDAMQGGVSSPVAYLIDMVLLMIQRWEFGCQTPESVS